MMRAVRHLRTQYQLSLRAGFGPRKAIVRAVRTYFIGF